MKKRVVFFEAEGGTDKGPDGHRRDTMPMVEALRAAGWSAETIFFRGHERDELFDRVASSADAYVSRINPGTIPGGEAAYFDTLRRLCAAGVLGMPHPDAMIGYGAKDALVKLVGTGLVPDDTTASDTVADFMRRCEQYITAADGSDDYVLGEINCSCVGFTTHLGHGIQEKIAAETIRRVGRAGTTTPA